MREWRAQRAAAGDPLARLDRAVARLDVLLAHDRRIGASRRVEASLRGIIREVADGRLGRAAERAERLAERLAAEEPA